MKQRHHVLSNHDSSLNPVFLTLYGLSNHQKIGVSLIFVNKQHTLHPASMFYSIKFSSEQRHPGQNAYSPSCTRELGIVRFGELKVPADRSPVSVALGMLPPATRAKVTNARIYVTETNGKSTRWNFIQKISISL